MTRRPTAPPPHHLLGMAILFLLVGLLVLTPVCGCSLKSQQIAHVGFQTGDVLSTYAGEKSGNGVEGNPLIPDAWSGRIALKAAVTSVMVYGTHRLAKAGHGTLARNLLMTVNALLAGVIVNNVAIASR